MTTSEGTVAQAPRDEHAAGGEHAEQPEPGETGVRTVLAGLAADIGLPLVTYYALHAAGVGDAPALLAGGAVAGARTVWVAIRERHLDPFAAAMVAALVLGSALVLVSGDPRFLLLKASVVTAAIGVVFLATAGASRPLTLAAEQSWRPRQAALLAEEFARDADVRHGHRVASRVWGAGLLVEAAVRGVLVYVLPVSVMVGLSTVMIVVTIVGLAAWTARYGRRNA
jgi:hypothetical protein